MLTGKLGCIFCDTLTHLAELRVTFLNGKATSDSAAWLAAIAKNAVRRLVVVFPQPSPCTHGRFLPGTRMANWRHKLALLTNCIGMVQQHTRLVECPLTADLLRRINSMDKPNGRLVLVSYAHYCASTSSLSTRWSSWALLFPFGLGDLILGRASRLYAFSGYHNRTSLPSRALGRTTGTQEVRPSRSSRTKDSPPQISYAHSR